VSERTKKQNALITVAYALGVHRFDKYLELHPIENFTATFGISKDHLRDQMPMHPGQYAENCLDDCKQDIYEYLHAFPGYLEALKTHMVSHSHEWFFDLLLHDRWDVNLSKIEFQKPLEYIVEEFFVEESDMEHFSEHPYFKKLKKLIIDGLQWH
jgi:hypothetical protein